MAVSSLACLKVKQPAGAEALGTLRADFHTILSLLVWLT